MTTKEVDPNPQASQSPYWAPGVSAATVAAAKAGIDLTTTHSKITSIVVKDGVVTYTQTAPNGNVGIYQFQGADMINGYWKKPGAVDTKYYNGPGVPPGIPGSGSLPATHDVPPSTPTPGTLPDTHATTSAAFMDSLPNDAHGCASDSGFYWDDKRQACVGPDGHTLQSDLTNQPVSPVPGVNAPPVVANPFDNLPMVAGAGIGLVIGGPIGGLIGGVIGWMVNKSIGSSLP